MLATGMLSFQTGAAIAKSLFPAFGPLGVVTLRISLAALLLGATLRPWRAPLTAAAWRAILPYGATLAAMNTCFYLALARMPLGPTVAIEFAGPLGLAIALSRHKRDLLIAALVITGLALLTGPTAHGHTLDPVGIAFALAALLILPLGATSLAPLRTHPALIWPALAIAPQSSALPYLLALAAMRRMTARAFGILMSLEPALAALSGLVLLHEHLTPLRWTGIAAIILASVVSVAERKQAPGAALDPGGGGGGAGPRRGGGGG